MLYASALLRQHRCSSGIRRRIALVNQGRGCNAGRVAAEVAIGGIRFLVKEMRLWPTILFLHC